MANGTIKTIIGIFLIKIAARSTEYPPVLCIAELSTE